MELTFEEKISQIMIAAHSELDLSDYDSTLCRDICNCYSHAMGCTLILEHIYRIGAICGKKDIRSEYASIKELETLLYQDFKVLDLGIEEYNGEKLLDNQYLIKLYVKSYRDNKIFDYHFIRCDNSVWTEKWRTQKATIVEENYYNFFPWIKVGTYIITK